MRDTKLLPVAAALLMATFLPSLGSAQNQNRNPNSRPAQPGTINYVEGQAHSQSAAQSQFDRLRSITGWAIAEYASR